MPLIVSLAIPPAIDDQSPPLLVVFSITIPESEAPPVYTIFELIGSTAIAWKYPLHWVRIYRDQVLPLFWLFETAERLSGISSVPPVQMT